ncbi:MAG: DUF2284 domain-containing protein [Oscillospiraceae bacterium]|nr:DUF2284 domain-containing protein [Oscillospiraceae bacterium]
MNCENKEAAKKYIELALKMGAEDAVYYEAPQICWDSRTLLKCMYGCTDWNKNHTCPSRANNPSMAEMKEMFSRYGWGIIIHTKEKNISQKISFAVESAAFHDGYYFAMSLSDCGLCKECAAVQCEDCRFKTMARPAFHSVGIDVFKTVRQMGLPIETLPNRDHPNQNWYSAVFVE